MPIYGKKWEANQNGFSISISFPWGYVLGSMQSFTPHYAINKTLPIHDSQFWMWSVTAFGHFQLLHENQSIMFYNWDKSQFVAIQDSHQAILQVVQEFEQIHVKHHHY